MNRPVRTRMPPWCGGRGKPPGYPITRRPSLREITEPTSIQHRHAVHSPTEPKARRRRAATNSNKLAAAGCRRARQRGSRVTVCCSPAQGCVAWCSDISLMVTRSNYSEENTDQPWVGVQQLVMRTSFPRLVLSF